MSDKTRYFAHSGRKQDFSDWQPLHRHLIEVGELAATAAGQFGAGAAGRLAGLLHDLGKYTLAFQRRLRGDEKVDHATAGARVVAALPGAHPVMRGMLAYLIAGHHAGLPDAGDLDDRLAKKIHEPDEVWRTELSPGGRDLTPRFAWVKDKGTVGFQLAFLGRMIFGCLIDADRRNTADFVRTVEPMAEPELWPSLPEKIDTLRDKFDVYMSKMPREGAVNTLRRKILGHVRGKAALDPGLFTLTVPTGGGKTLASLGFALDHVKAHLGTDRRLERVVYAIPFTSIIDQTVDRFEEVLGADYVLAHHSGFGLRRASDESEFDGKEDKRLRLAMEDWAAPIVVTTNVQLFESLFSHRPSQCRKLRSLARSVIVLDEAQTIPLHVLRPCLAVLDELVRNYGCTVVLCTATQPAVLAPNYKGGLRIERPERELAPDPDALHRKLRRVKVRFADDKMTDDDLVAELKAVPQALVVVNTRKHALDLYRTGAAEMDHVIHLTTRQYGAHRRRILAEIRQRLRDGLPCRVVATSLIEAGVDVDFPRAWRAEAGLDSVAQVAGRVNREGRRDPEQSLVTVFVPAEAKPPREIEGFIGDRQRAALDPNDPLSPLSIENYFGEVYWRTADRHDVTRTAEGRSIRVLDAATFGVSGGQCRFQYRTVGESFRLIKSGLAPVIVAIEPAAKDALADLKKPEVRAGKVARALQPFIVQVPPRARARLIVKEHAFFAESDRFGDQFCVLRSEGLYREDTGLLWEDADYLEIEGLIQ